MDVSGRIGLRFGRFEWSGRGVLENDLHKWAEDCFIGKQYVKKSKTKHKVLARRKIKERSVFLGPRISSPKNEIPKLGIFTVTV